MSALERQEEAEEPGRLNHHHRAHKSCHHIAYITTLATMDQSMAMAKVDNKIMGAHL